jgi:hypothetical protein
MLFGLLGTLLLAFQEPHGGHGHPERVPETLLDRVRSQEATGTGWQPGLSPHAAMHGKFEGWELMTHAAVFAGFDAQTGRRSDDAFFSTNWIMVAGRRPLGSGELTLRAMASAEAVTVGDEGYPLLLQSGEGLADHQHPHDLFMELSAGWAVPLSEGVGAQVYAAVVGEPALGPVTFHHRHSASADPAAPLGHHWQDATHISPGVLTGGLFTPVAKLEASWFNGREPDDNRLDIDFDVPDSYSARLTVNPAPAWSIQASAGRLDEPEEDEPGVSVFRSTASAMVTGRLGGGGAWSATAAWGRNDPSEGDPSDSYLVEATVELDGTHTVFGRLEHVRKSGRDLQVDPSLDDDLFPVASLSAGYLFTFARIQDQELALGVRATANRIDEDLRAFYGDEVEWGFIFFLRLRPGLSETHARSRP